MHSLGDLIRSRVAAWDGMDLPLERALFGTVDPDAIAAAVDAFCDAHLGSHVAHYLFFEASSGSAHGVELVDGRQVVVKGHRAEVRPEHLAAVQALQHDLASNGYPAPRPLVGPVAVGHGHLTVETLLAGDLVDAHDPRVRAALAHGLADFVRLAAPHRAAFAAVPAPMRVPDDASYPVPHSPRFDFASTSAGAEWIDELAARARERLRVSSDAGVLLHGDWRIENVRVARAEIVAVYDWDAVCIEREVVGLAAAALTFSVDWTRPIGEHFPTAAEITAFVREYEQARGGAVDSTALAPAMVATLTYGARCEHSIGLVSDGDSFTTLLRALGAPLLDQGLAALGPG